MPTKPNIWMRFFKGSGFEILNDPPKEMLRCVLLYVPHTSNWDYVYGVSCMKGLNVPIKVAIKKIWTRFPFSLVINTLGGVAIDRSKKSGISHVEQLANIFNKYDDIALIITPEGSRSLRTEWKTGFYFIAKAAKVPIITIKGNYEERNIEFGPVIYPDQKTLEETMRELSSYFKDSKAKFPKDFSVDTRYI